MMTAMEILEALVIQSEGFKKTKQWQNSDDGKAFCMTIRIPVSLINRAKETIQFSGEQHEQD
jgi:hypothetical protein